MSEEIISQEGELYFDLTPTVVALTMKTKKGKEKFEIREASADSVAKWRNMLVRASNTETGKLKPTSGFWDTAPFLVSECLFRFDEDTQSWTSVTEKYVRDMPDQVVAKLLEKAQAISGLAKKGEEEETEESLTAKIKELTEKLTALRNKGAEAKKE